MPGVTSAKPFILYTIEGFTVEEIADISNHSAEQVRADIRSGREAPANRLAPA